MSRRSAVNLGVALLAAALAALAASDRAAASCQLQWQPDPFGESGGSLVPVCDDPSAPTGEAGDSDDPGGSGDGQREPSFAAIVVNMTTVEDGDGEFTGTASAGHRTRAIAIREAKRACHRNESGECRTVATVKDGWVALVVGADAAQRLRVFGGSGRSYEAAFGAATRQAREALGENVGGPIERVKAVRSKPR
jgi:uncharacterized protein DUF4189